MPLPKPNKGESEDQFISRCMSDEKMKSEYGKKDQRVAVCYSQWERANEGDEMNIIYKYLTENKQLRSMAVNKAIDSFGLPETGPNVHKFAGDSDYWVVVLEFKGKFYAMDSSNQVWEGKSYRYLKRKIETETGIKLGD